MTPKHKERKKKKKMEEIKKHPQNLKVEETQTPQQKQPTVPKDNYITARALLPCPD